MTVGATGNLGSLPTRDLLTTEHHLRLPTHKRNLPCELPAGTDAEIVHGDLDDPASLQTLCDNIDCVIYLAGVLFRPHPEKFLHHTKTVYVQNIVDAAALSSVRKFILISFPHIEENTTPDHPARGVIETEPKSIHARTRLAAEKYLFRVCKNKPMIPIVLRAGVIYGSGLKFIEAAHWLMRHRLMAIWHKPTWIHLLALPDLLRIVQIAVEKDGLFDIYNCCDDEPLLLQDFLDTLAVYWNYSKPWHLPAWASMPARHFVKALRHFFTLQRRSWSTWCEWA